MRVVNRIEAGIDERGEGVWSSCCKAGTEGRQEEEREQKRNTKKEEQSDYNRDVLQSMGSPLEIVLNVSLWNHWPGLSFCS